MEKQIKVIIENGIIGLLEEYFDWYGELNDAAQFIFDTLFEDEEFNFSEKGKNVVEIWAKSIEESCSSEEIALAYDCVKDKSAEFNEDFYNIFPKIFANLLLEVKEFKAENKPVNDEMQVAYQVVEYLGRQTLGANKFVKMVKAETVEKNENDKQETL